MEVRGPAAHNRPIRTNAWRRRATLRTIVFLGLALACPAAANVRLSGVRFPMRGTASLRITMRVVNSSVVPVKRLAQAETIAGQILGDAGVEVIWVDCAKEAPAGGTAHRCAQDRGPAEFWLHLLTRDPSNLHGDVTGFAVLPPLWRDGDGYAGVSYSMVEAAARSLDVEASYVLGATLAHEIGHLLLGARCHSPSGVMSPRLRLEQFRMAARGELRFTPGQAGQIRVEVARRMAR